MTYGPDRTRTERLADEALQIARRLDDSRTLAHVLMARGLLLGLEPARQRMPESAELLALAEANGDVFQQSLGSVIRFVAALEAADPAEAKRCLDRSRKATDLAGQPLTRWILSLQDALMAAFEGDFPAAERLIEHGLEVGATTGQPDARLLPIIQLAYVRFEQGGGDEVLLDEMLTAVPGHPSFRAQLAYIRWRAGHEEAARADAASLADQLEVFPQEAAWARAMGLMALLCGELEDASLARRLYGLLTPHAGLCIASGIAVFGVVDLYLGILATVLGRFDDAETHFSVADRMHEAAGAPAWLARTPAGVGPHAPEAGRWRSGPSPARAGAGHRHPDRPGERGAPGPDSRWRTFSG